MMTDAEEGKSQLPAKRLGVGFPTLALAETAIAVKELGKYGKTHRLASLAGHLGHATTNSGPFRRKLAALRDWGVIAGKGDEFTLTPTGLAIALPDDAAEEQAALRQAFFSSGVFASAYEVLVKNHPLSLEAIGNTAVRNLGIGAGSKDDFVRSFAASAVVAGVAERPNAGSLVLRPVDASAVETDKQRRSEVANSSITASGSSGAPVLRQVWRTSLGDITLEVRSTRALSASVFAQIGIIVADIETLASKLDADASQGLADGEGQ